MPQTVIETTGETVGEETSAKASSVDAKDLPIYSVARAVEWMKRPENAPKIEQAAKVAGEATREAARAIDREVTNVWRQLVEISTDEEAEQDFINAFLKTLM
jgi:hypothetical protein